MVNKYQRSLQLYEGMLQRKEEFDAILAAGMQIPEEELVIFVRDLHEHWPHMLAVEQRTDFRRLNRYARQMIDLKRFSSGRKSVITEPYRSIDGKIVRKNALIPGQLDVRVHKEREQYTLEEIRRRATL